MRRERKDRENIEELEGRKGRVRRAVRMRLEEKRQNNNVTEGKIVGKENISQCRIDLSKCHPTFF
jgi:hypothetical protein